MLRLHVRHGLEQDIILGVMHHKYRIVAYAANQIKNDVQACMDNSQTGGPRCMGTNTKKLTSAKRIS